MKIYYELVDPLRYRERCDWTWVFELLLSTGLPHWRSTHQPRSARQCESPSWIWTRPCLSKTFRRRFPCIRTCPSRWCVLLFFQRPLGVPLVVPRSGIPHEHFDMVISCTSGLHGCNRTYLLMHRPGYTLSLDHVPPTEWSRVITVTLLNPSCRRTYALMRPATPAPRIAIGSENTLLAIWWRCDGWYVRVEKIALSVSTYYVHGAQKAQGMSRLITCVFSCSMKFPKADSDMTRIVVSSIRCCQSWKGVGPSLHVFIVLRICHSSATDELRRTDRKYS